MQSSLPFFSSSELASAQRSAPTLDSARLRWATAQARLLTPFALGAKDLRQALSLLGKRGVDDADLYFQLTHAQSWSLEEGIVKSGAFSINQGVGVRAVHGTKTAFAYADDINTKSLMDAAEQVKTIASEGRAARIALPHRSRLSPARELYGQTDPGTSLDSGQKVALLEKIERMARAADTRVTQVMASLSSEWELVLIARLDGTRAADVRPLVRLSLTVVVEKSEGAVMRRETGSSGGGGRFDFAYFNDAVLKQYVADAVYTATSNLDARPAPAGAMPVVLGAGWPGVLLHEAVGHGLEGDFNRKGSSAFTGKIGQRVAASGVTVIDDGTLAHRRGSLNVDDEGHPTQRNILIEDGILCGYLQDSMNARLMGVAPTGNARREGYAHLPMPRMTNTYMLGGNYAPEEIISSIKRGIYASNFGGGQVDITSGKFVFSTSLAFWVENGKIQYPVKGATLIGAGPQSLKTISMLGNDLALDSGVGVCGKEGQSVPVGVGQPTLRLEGLTVGGTA